MTQPLRHLVLILGDQLDEDASALQDFDPLQDAVWMAEVAEESTHVWSAKQRTTVFLSAMRHFAEQLRELGFPVHYCRLDDPDNAGTLAAELSRTLAQTRPATLLMTAPTSSARCATSPGMPKAASSCAWNSSTVNCASALAS